MWKPGFMRLNLGRTFWSIIVSELFERMAWYGFFVVAPLFLTGSVKEGALGLSHTDKGSILAIVPFCLYLFPLISGTIGDKFGYKRVLLAAFVMLSLSYFLLSFATGYYSFLFLFLFVALGAGTFKPMATATVAHATRGEEDKASTGFGIFYTVVNFGGFVGPMIGGLMRPSFDERGQMHGSWNYVFYASSAYMAAMFAWTVLFYKEPLLQKNRDPLLRKLRETITDLVGDWRLLVLLVILSGFWLSYLQFFYIMPTWITEWVDTSYLASFSLLKPWVSNGQLKAEMLVNLNALVVILLSVYISGKIARFSLLKVINMGILILSLALFGFAVAATPSGGSYALASLSFMIVVFTVGELLGSPRINDLMGRIAPSGKEGVYQGYGFLSVALGFFSAGHLSSLYGTFADKTGMYRQELITRFGYHADAVQGINLHDLGVLLRGKGITLSQLDLILWQTHRPYMIWVLASAVGLISAIALTIYCKFVSSSVET